MQHRPPSVNISLSYSIFYNDTLCAGLILEVVMSYVNKKQDSEEQTQKQVLAAKKKD